MNKNNDEIGKLQKIMISRFDKIDKMLERMIRLKDCLEGDELLDNQDVCMLLNVAKRTLAGYRQKKLIRYYMGDGKCYYKFSEIEEFLKQKGKL